MPLSLNYFELFELPVSFDLDMEQLAANYRKIQRAVHPDNFVDSSEQERRVALQKTIQINEAFQILKNPLTRGQYLLRLHQIELEISGVVNGDFLMQQIDLHEELQSIKQQQQPEVLTHFISRIDQQIQELINQINQQFSHRAYPEAKQSLQQLQFFKRLHEDAMNLEI